MDRVSGDSVAIASSTNSRGTGSHTGFQFSILSASCAAGLILLRRTRTAASLLAFLIALLLGTISLLPTPGSLQYFCMIVPFLIVAAVCLGSDYLISLQSRLARRLAGAACVLLLASFVGFAFLNFQEYLFTGREVPGIFGAAPNWTLEQVTAVSLAIDQLASPGEKVASFWPGYIVVSWADPYPGFENDFGGYVSGSFTAEKRQKYHLFYDPEIIAAFARRGPRFAVVGNQGTFVGGPESSACITMLHAYGYRLARMVGQTSIYECCETSRSGMLWNR